MTATKRQMHLAVFWLGTGNHSAGWRMKGAADSHCSWPIVEAGARIAERGKFDRELLGEMGKARLAGAVGRAQRRGAHR